MTPDLRPILQDSTAPQWRTIDSAPRDGTPILIWQSHKRKYYVPGDNFDDDRYAIGYWRVGIGGWGNRNDSDVKPTHWMPLPLPPSGVPE